MAAGVSLSPANLDAFRARLNELARRALKPDELQPPLRLDAEVSLDDMTLECLAALDQLRPTGQGNPPVQFFARNLTQQRPPQRMGAEKQHLKMWVTDGATTHEAVWWGAGNEPLPAARFDLAFAPADQRLQRPPHRAVESARLASHSTLRVACDLALRLPSA